MESHRTQRVGRGGAPGMVSEVGRLIDAYFGKQKFPPTLAWVAREVGVAKSTVSHWHRGDTSPRPEHLRRLAQVLEMPYSRLVDAVVVDQGYYTKEGEGHDEPAATKTAREDTGRVGEVEDRLRAAGFSESAVKDARAGEVVRDPGHNTPGHSVADKRRRRMA